MQMKNQDQATGQGKYPIDNRTYDLMQVIVSKCESIDAYQKYSKDVDGNTRDLFQEMIQQDQKYVHKLMDALKQSMR